MDIAGRKPDAAWLRQVVETVGLAERASSTGPPSSPAVSSSASPWPCALAARPEIIFGDEPTGNLDSRAGAEVLGFLRRSVDEPARPS